MNELKSYTEYAVSTPTADFVIGFDFNYGEDAVNVTVDDVPATEAGYTVVYLNETTIRLSPSVPSGVVRLQRETDIDQSDHAYRAGAKFIAQTMDENFEQLRHSQQEVRDGFTKLKGDTYTVIDGLDEALELAQDAAQDAQDAATIAQDAADTVNAIIIGDKVAADKVLDESGLSQQQWNDGVESIADLLAIQNPKNGSRVYVKSYHAGLNVGGGLFVYDDARVSENDLASVFNGWIRIGTTHPVSIYCAGAKCDGVTDDTVALQRGLNIFKNIQISGNLLITAGILLENSMSVCGLGRNLSRITFNASSENLSLFNPNGADYLHFSRFAVVGSGKSSALNECFFNAFGGSNERQAVFEELHISGFSKSALYLGAQWHLTINNTEMLQNNIAIHFDKTGMPSDLAGSGNVIQDCYFGSNNYGVYNSGGWNVTYLNPIFESNNIPMFIGGNSRFNVIQTPWFEANTNPPVFNDPVLLIGGRGESMASNSMSQSDRGSIKIDGFGIATYTTDTPNMKWDAAQGFTKFKGSISDIGFSSNYTSSGVLDGLRIHGNTAKGMYSQGSGSSTTQSENKTVNIQSYTGYFSVNLNSLTDANLNTGLVGFEHERDAGGSGRTRNHFVVYTGTTNGSVRDSYAKRLDISPTGIVNPGSDNSQSLGSTALRWSTVYAGTGTISTSDERMKQQFRSQSEAEKLAALEIKKSICLFKFNDAVENKGDGARWHVGVKAQQIIGIMQSHGLNPFEYAFVCYDEWEATEDHGSGNRYAIRYEELVMFILSAI